MAQCTAGPAFAAAALCLLWFLPGPAAARQSGEEGAGADFVDPAVPASVEPEDVPAPPARPQVPYAQGVPEVTVYGQRLPFGLPDTVRGEIWESERRQFEALMLERERLSNDLARDGFEALLGDRLTLLPGYNPARERQIDYGVNDSTPAGVVPLLRFGFGGDRN